MKIEIVKGEYNGLFSNTSISITELELFNMSNALEFLKEVDALVEKYSSKGARQV